MEDCLDVDYEVFQWARFLYNILYDPVLEDLYPHCVASETSALLSDHKLNPSLSCSVNVGSSFKRIVTKFELRQKKKNRKRISYFIFKMMGILMFEVKFSKILI